MKIHIPLFNCFQMYSLGNKTSILIQKAIKNNVNIVP